MILRELFYTDPDTQAVANDMRHSPNRDKSVMQRNDTRKTRLSLKQLNRLRKASDMHVLEQDAELEFVQRMYKMPEPEAAGPGI
jgi:hypothetical protein